MADIRRTAAGFSMLLCGIVAAPTTIRGKNPSSPFLGVVYRYADAMLQHGRDKYGPVETGLLLAPWIAAVWAL